MPDNDGIVISSHFHGGLEKHENLDETSSFGDNEFPEGFESDDRGESCVSKDAETEISDRIFPNRLDDFGSLGIDSRMFRSH